jgi:hypothetical protein
VSWGGRPLQIDLIESALHVPASRRAGQGGAQVAYLVRDLHAELLAQLLVAGLGVFDGVVQQRGGQPLSTLARAMG